MANTLLFPLDIEILLRVHPTTPSGYPYCFPPPWQSDWSLPALPLPAVHPRSKKIPVLAESPSDRANTFPVRLRALPTAKSSARPELSSVASASLPLAIRILRSRALALLREF